MRCSRWQADGQQQQQQRQWLRNVRQPHGREQQQQQHRKMAVAGYDHGNCSSYTVWEGGSTAHLSHQRHTRPAAAFAFLTLVACPGLCWVYLASQCAVLCLLCVCVLQVSATVVDPKLDYNGIHKWVQSLGFVRQDTIGEGVWLLWFAGPAAF
jgi:hypothetical protein